MAAAFALAAAVALVITPYVDLTGPVPVLQAVLPVLALGVILVALALAVFRRWWGALIAGVTALAMLAPVLPWPGRPTVDAATTSPGLRVLSVNALYGQVDSAAVLDAVRTHDVDVLVMVEATPPQWTSLQNAGLGEVFPHATGRVHDSTGGSWIATKEPFTCLDIAPGMTCGEVIDPGPDANGFITADVEAWFDHPSIRLADGTIVKAVHPQPPASRRNDGWRREQSALTTWAAAQPSDARVVMAGDFNASRMHPAFRQLSEGWVDAPRDGFPWTRTWPLGRLWPFVQLDHVLSRGFAVRDEGVIRLPGSDHAAVWADLVPVAAARS